MSRTEDCLWILSKSLITDAADRGDLDPKAVGWAVSKVMVALEKEHGAEVTKSRFREAVAAGTIKAPRCVHAHHEVCPNEATS